MTTQTPSQTEENRALIAAFYAAGLKGDIDKMTEMLAPDIVIHEPAYLPYGGVYRGKEGLMELYTAIQLYMDVERITVRYLVADGDTVIAVIGSPDRNTGQFNHFAEESRIRDGKIAEMWLYYHDPQSMLGARN